MCISNRGDGSDLQHGTVRGLRQASLHAFPAVAELHVCGLGTVMMVVDEIKCRYGGGVIFSVAELFVSTL